jgi:peptidoglycan-associated lipoprotein
MTNQKSILIAIAVASLMTAACAKKTVAVAQPAPAPAPAAENRPAPAPPAAKPAEPARQTAAAPAPASRYPDAATKARIEELIARISDAYFDYNEASLRPDAVKTLNADSIELRDILKNYPDYKLTIQGHADERGSAEYNMALGDKRADAAKEYLVNVGIPAGQLLVVSFGKEKPVCQDHDEACWQKNRRIHIVEAAPSR